MLRGGSGAAVISRIIQIIDIFCFALAFDANWSIWGAVLAPTGFRRASSLGISQGFRRIHKNLRKIRPPDLPFFNFWKIWKRYFDVFGRFSKLITFSVSAVGCA